MFTNFYDWYYPQLENKEAKAQKIQVAYPRDLKPCLADSTVFISTSPQCHCSNYNVQNYSPYNLHKDVQCSITFNISQL